MKIDKFNLKKQEINKSIDENNKVMNKYINIRIVDILAFIVILITLFSKKTNIIPFVILLIITFIIWVYLTIIVAKYKRIDKKYRYMLEAINHYLARFNANYKKEKEDNEFARGEYFETDLDIFGPQSLYNYITVAKTAYGKKALSNALEANLTDEETLIKRQDAVSNFATNFDSTLKIVSASYEYKQNNPNVKIKNIESGLKSLDNVYKPSFIKVSISIIYFLVLVTLFILSSVKIVTIYLPIAFIFVGFFASMFINSEASSLSNDLSNAKKVLFGYDELIDEISKYETNNNYINNLTSKVKTLSSKSIKHFFLISSLSESRKNILFQILSNGLFMLDSYIVLFYNIWQKKHKDSIYEALNSIGEIEALISLASIELVRDTSTKPLISSKFEFTNIKHPLIEDAKCIPNSFVFKDRNIITGSNMSGKTTFMRSIGTNYVLFLAGASVCAESFEAPILKLFTSMKVVDDVNNNISTFYGEILRIKAICDYSKENKPMLVLVDEIFKGTNTKDRIVGATKAIEKLDKDNIFSIVTTHDPELCSIEGVKNYHFLEHYEEDKIKFDYKIHDGISQTRNAIYLLKLAGIIDE